MATELGAAFVSVTLETSKLAGEIKKTFNGAGADAESAGKSVGSKFGGAVGIAAAAVGALGIGTFLKGAITGAGDLQQSAGAIGSVFKENAGQMLQWSQTADSALGLTQNEFNELGTLIGSQLKNGGTAMDQLAPKTNALITTGADLASMFGGTTSEAVEALSSALKGERDPIEKYGVSLNQAKIDAEAAALGFEKVGGSFDQTAQQAATLSLISKQTADATGNFAKESETLAGQQQRMSAGFKDVQTNIGGLLLPALTSMFGYINTNILPVIDKFTAGLGDQGLAGAFKPIMDVAGPIFSSLGASFGPLIPQILQLASSFSPLGLIFKVIQPILPQLVGLFTQLGSIVAGVLGTALTAFTPIVEMLVTHLSGLAVAVMPAVTQLIGVLGQGMAQLAPIIGGIIAQLAPLIASLLTQLSPIITNLVTAILPPLISIFSDVVTAIGPLITVLMAALIPAIEALMPVVVTVFSFVADLIKNVMQAVQGVIQVVTGIISGDWSRVWQGIQNIFGAIWNNIVTLVTGVIAVVGSVIAMGLNNVSRIVGSVLGAIGNFFADTWNNVVNGVSGMIGNVVGFFSGLIGKITGAIGNAGNALFNTGRDIVQGLIDGISGMMGAIGRAVLSIVPEAIRGPFEDLLGIHSPSRVFREYGVNIGQGLILGIDGMHGKVASSVTGLVDVPAAPSFSASAYTPASFGGPALAGGVHINGPINVRDENEMARLILNSQRDAQAAYGF